MTRDLLRLLSRIDKGDFAAIKPAVKMLRAQRYEREAFFAERQVIVDQGSMFCVTGPWNVKEKKGKWQSEDATVHGVADRLTGEKLICGLVSKFVRDRPLTPDVYTLRTDLDWPTIYALAADPRVCCDYLLEKEADRGNLLWGLAQTADEHVEGMVRTIWRLLDRAADESFFCSGRVSQVAMNDLRRHVLICFDDDTRLKVGMAIISPLQFTEIGQSAVSFAKTSGQL